MVKADEIAASENIVRSGSVAFALYAGSAGLAYCSQLVAARLMGATSFGVYAYVLAWMTVFAYFCALGFDISLLRFVSAYRATQRWDLLRGIVRYAEVWVSVVGFSIAAIGITAALNHIGSTHQTARAFAMGFPLVPLLALLWIRCSTVRALGGLVSAIAPERIIRDGGLIAVLSILALLSPHSIGAPMAMLSAVISTIVALAIVTASRRRLFTRTVSIAPPAYDRELWRRTALPLMIITAVEILWNRTGVIVLGWLGDTHGAGLYSLAFNIAFVVALPRTAINAAFAPAISDLFVRNHRTELQILMARASFWTLMSALGLALPLWLLAEPILRLFGPEFVSAALLVRILLMGQVIAAAFGSQLYVMTMTGEQTWAAVIIVATVSVNFLLTIWLTDHLGRAGAAAATATTLVLWNAAMAFFIRRRLVLWPSLVGFIAPTALHSTSTYDRGAEARMEDERPKNAHLSNESHRTGL
jgi:O-antigen/teichoic acid export membrane protein